MKTFLRISPVALFAASVAHAHPGHDGHELVWEYNGGHVHVDWMIWAALAGAATLALFRYAKSRS